MMVGIISVRRVLSEFLQATYITPLGISRDFAVDKIFYAHNFWGKGTLRGSMMVLLGRAVIYSYMLSIPLYPPCIWRHLAAISEMGPLSSQGSSWFRPISHRFRGALTCHGRTDRQTELVSQKAVLELNHVTDLLCQTGQGPLFTVRILVTRSYSQMKMVKPRDRL